MAFEVVVVRELPGSALAADLLARYYAELDYRFPEGFSTERTVAVAPEELVAPRGAFLVAYLGERPVGCGALRKLDLGIAEIKRMWIDPEVRGRGVGRRLLESLEETALELGCQVVRLDTSAYLPEAIALYISSGFDEIAAYNDNAYAAHWFEKRL